MNSMVFYAFNNMVCVQCEPKLHCHSYIFLYFGTIKQQKERTHKRKFNFCQFSGKNVILTGTFSVIFIVSIFDIIVFFFSCLQIQKSILFRFFKILVTLCIKIVQKKLINIKIEMCETNKEQIYNQKKN